MVTDRRRRQTGRVRIIGGAWRGRRLDVVPGIGIRPTPDRVRETLFNWLMPMLPGARCLDLYAGTGALGLEALSRGAAHGSFVERDPRAAAAIEAALGRFGGSGQVLVTDARRWLRETPAVPCDLVFVDPPYGTSDPGELCTLLSRGWLAAHAWIYLEMGCDQAVPDLPATWYLHRETTAGAVRSLLLRLP